MKRHILSASDTEADQIHRTIIVVILVVTAFVILYLAFIGEQLKEFI